MRNVLAVAMACTMAGSLFAATPVETHGELKVTGNKIVDKTDEPTQIVGPSLFWSVWGGENFYNKDVVDWVAKDWKASVIRAAIGIEPAGGYLTDSAAQINNAIAVIDAAIENGMYVIVDWHDHNANLNVLKAKEFFGTLSEKYGDIPNLIWEIWNEPEKTNGTGTNGLDTWADIKAYAAEVIPVIRKKSDNIILVGTPSWCQKIKEAARSPINEPNIAYVLHFYAKTHKEWLRNDADTALSLGVALFISEFGMTNADGGSLKNPGIDAVETGKWLDWAYKNKISWANWALNDKNESSAALLPGADTLGNWPATELSESGTWIKDRILKTVDPTYVSSIRNAQPTLRNGSYIYNGFLYLQQSSKVEVVGLDMLGRNMWTFHETLSPGNYKLSQWTPGIIATPQHIRVTVNGDIVSQP